MKLLSWNINGLRSVIRKKDFEKLLINQNPDVLCLQEIRALPTDLHPTLSLPSLPPLTISNYSHFFWNPAVKKGYSGTMIISKQLPLWVGNGMKMRKMMPS